MIISSVSCTIDFHFCQGHLKSFGLFGKAKNCHEMAAKTTSCKHHQTKSSNAFSCNKQDQNCCENKTIHFESENNEQIKIVEPIIIDYQYLADKEDVHFCKFLDQKNEDVPSIKRYKPPLIQKDIPVVFESLLL